MHIYWHKPGRNQWASMSACDHSVYSIHKFRSIVIRFSPPFFSHFQLTTFTTVFLHTPTRRRNFFCIIKNKLQKNKRINRLFFTFIFYRPTIDVNSTKHSLSLHTYTSFFQTIAENTTKQKGMTKTVNEQKKTTINS